MRTLFNYLIDEQRRRMHIYISFALYHKLGKKLVPKPPYPEGGFCFNMCSL